MTFCRKRTATSIRSEGRNVVGPGRRQPGPCGRRSKRHVVFDKIRARPWGWASSVGLRKAYASPGSNPRPAIPKASASATSTQNQSPRSRGPWRTTPKSSCGQSSRSTTTVASVSRLVTVTSGAPITSHRKSLPCGPAKTGNVKGFHRTPDPWKRSRWRPS